MGGNVSFRVIWKTFLVVTVSGRCHCRLELGLDAERSAVCPAIPVVNLPGP